MTAVVALAAMQQSLMCVCVVSIKVNCADKFNGPQHSKLSSALSRRYSLFCTNISVLLTKYYAGIIFEQFLSGLKRLLFTPQQKVTNDRSKLFQVPSKILSAVLESGITFFIFAFVTKTLGFGRVL